MVIVCITFYYYSYYYCRCRRRTVFGFSFPPFPAPLVIHFSCLHRCIERNNNPSYIRLDLLEFNVNFEGTMNMMRWIMMSVEMWAIKAVEAGPRHVSPSRTSTQCSRKHFLE